MLKSLQHVLCIDDEEDILEIVDICLSEVNGLKVSCENNVEEALKHMSSLNPDIILLDMMMPQMDGLSALRLFRKVDGFSGIPIVLMTARVQNHEVKEYMDAGATAVIKKPFDPMTLGDEVLKVWDSLP